MTDKTDGTSAKLINLTQVWPIHARRTLRNLWNGEPGRLVGREVQPMTLHVDNINLMRVAPPDYGGTRISTRFNGEILVEETREDILKMIAEPPKP
jgi:hypothetical protein